MTEARWTAAGALLWAVGGAAIALSSLSNVNDDARLVVGVFSVLGPAAAVAAAVFALRGSAKLVGALLVVSALATPTYFAYALNLLPLAVGVWLLVSRRPLSRRPATSGTP